MKVILSVEKRNKEYMKILKKRMLGYCLKMETERNYWELVHQSEAVGSLELGQSFDSFWSLSFLFLSFCLFCLSVFLYFCLFVKGNIGSCSVHQSEAVGSLELGQSFDS